MEYTHLGRTGLLVRKLCLGTMAFGNNCDEKEACRKLHGAAATLGSARISSASSPASYTREARSSA